MYCFGIFLCLCKSWCLRLCVCLCSLLAFLAVCFCCVWTLPHLHPVPGLLSASTAQAYILFWYCIIYKFFFFFSDSTWWQAVYEVHWPEAGRPSSWKRLWRKLSHLWPWKPCRPLPQYLGMHYNQHKKNPVSTQMIKTHLLQRVRHKPGIKYTSNPKDNVQSFVHHRINSDDNDCTFSCSYKVTFK